MKVLPYVVSLLLLGMVGFIQKSSQSGMPVLKPDSAIQFTMMIAKPDSATEHHMPVKQPEALTSAPEQAEE
jgi:hypothetical protein